MCITEFVKRILYSSFLTNIDCTHNKKQTVALLLNLLVRCQVSRTFGTATGNRLPFAKTESSSVYSPFTSSSHWTPENWTSVSLREIRHAEESCKMYRENIHEIREGKFNLRQCYVGHSPRYSYIFVIHVSWAGSTFVFRWLNEWTNYFHKSTDRESDNSVTYSLVR